MRLFKVHAVMRGEAGGRWHRVRSYVVSARDWQDARQQVAAREPEALFVTVPDDVQGPLMTSERSISAQECADLRAASDWNEARLLTSERSGE